MIEERHVNGRLKDKEFIARNSLLTDLFESPHFQTIYHIFVAFLIVLFLDDVVYNYMATGKLIINFELIFWAFGKFHVVVVVWTLMFFCTLILVYRGFILWARNRNDNSMYDYVWLSIYIAYLSVFFYLPAKQIAIYVLPPASSFIILAEQIRLLMKTHAFIRSNVPNILQKRDTKKPNNELCPDFWNYLYFLFAPTLIYKDDYPRNKEIRWKYVISNFAQVIGCIFYFNFLSIRFMFPLFKKFGLEPIKSEQLVHLVFNYMLPTTLMQLIMFFLLYHSWLNAFAEMLRFSDRMFYQDWWNSRSFSEFFRKWNIFIQDWLYIYIYKDVSKFFLSNNVVSLYAVFTISAIVHEYIMMFSFRFFYPMMYIAFAGFGVGLMFLSGKRQTRILNVFMWVLLLTGPGLIMSMYTIEWYARINCPPYDDTYMDYFVPRSWICYPLPVSHAQ